MTLKEATDNLYRAALGMTETYGQSPLKVIEYQRFDALIQAVVDYQQHPIVFSGGKTYKPSDSVQIDD